MPPAIWKLAGWKLIGHVMSHVRTTNSPVMPSVRGVPHFYEVMVARLRAGIFRDVWALSGPLGLT